MGSHTRIVYLWHVCLGLLGYLIVTSKSLSLSPGQTDLQVDASFGLAFNLRFVWPPTCVDLRRLVTTCFDFGRPQIWTQVDAKFLPFGHPAQVDTSRSQVICCYNNALTKWMICMKFTAFCDLRIRLATLRKYVRKFWFCKLALTCVDLRRLVSPFGQSFSREIKL